MWSLSCVLSFKHLNCDSRVVITCKLLIFTTLVWSWQFIATVPNLLLYEINLPGYLLSHSINVSAINGGGYHALGPVQTERVICSRIGQLNTCLKHAQIENSLSYCVNACDLRRSERAFSKFCFNDSGLTSKISLFKLTSVTRWLDFVFNFAIYFGKLHYIFAKVGSKLCPKQNKPALNCQSLLKYGPRGEFWHICSH